MESGTRISGFRIICIGFFGGVLLGIIARLWMRWISTDPEFSWSGTIFIVGAFTIAMSAQAIALVLRRRVTNRRISKVIKAGALICVLPIFTGAGGMMFPTVALASTALWIDGLNRGGRRVLLSLSLIPPLLVSRDIIVNFGWTILSAGRILLFGLIYSAVILALRPIMQSGGEEKGESKPWSRKRKSIFSIVLIFGVLLFLVLTFGFPRG